MSVTFKDVTACFSEEEWKLLHEKEKLFYIGVMQKIHQALITMGYHILNPEMLLQVLTWKVICEGDRMNPKSRADLHDPTSSIDRAVVPTPDIYLRIQDKEEQSYKDLQTSEETESGTVPMTGHLMATPDVSLQIKEEEEPGSIGSEGRETLACDPGHQFIHPETLLYINKWEDSAHVDAQDSKSQADLAETISSHHLAISTPSEVVLRIQQKQEHCGRDAATPEEEKMINSLCTGPLMATPDISLQIKEEEEPGSMVCEGREALACDPGHQSIYPETLLQAIKWEDSANVDAQDSKSQADLAETISSHHTAISPPPEAVLRIQKEEEQCGRDAASPEEGKMIYSLGTGPLMATPDISLQIKEEEEPGSMVCEGREALACDPGHQSIHPETLLQAIKWEDSANVDAQESKRKADLVETISSHHTAISPPPEAVLRIQKEEEQCGRDAASPEEGKMIYSLGTENGTLVKTKCLQTNQRQFNFQKEKWDLTDEEHKLSTELIKKCVHLQNSQIPCTSLESEKCPLDNTRDRPFKSTEYKKTFSDLPALQMPHRIHAGEKPFECTECEKSFRDPSTLKMHCMIHTEGKLFECRECKKCFRRSSDLKVHQRIHTGEKPYECTRCKKVFSRLSALKIHQMVHTGEKPFECRECKKCFRRSSYLKVHQRTHTGEKPYECSECDKSFQSHSYLKVHQRTHTGEKPYACTRCKKVFTRLSDMKNHQSIHTAEKPYLCSECGKSFRDSSALIRHQKIHARERPFRCTQCEKDFFSISAMKVHERIHTGEKPYECSECEKSFRALSTLKLHCMIHTEEKLFECRECKKCFRRSSYLKVHQRIHTGEKPYK